MEVINLEQGSPEWLEYRLSQGNASEVSALFDSSPFMPKTRLQLWEVKKGFREVFINANMQRGNDLEPIARQLLEEKTGHIFEPVVLKEGRISASLDGITFDGDVICEIKCPAKGEESLTWKHVEENNSAPSHYYLQIQQQLYVSKADFCIFAVLNEDATDIIYCEVKPDQEAIDKILAAWEVFFGFYDSNTPPPYGPNDIIDMNDDQEWQEASNDYILAKIEYDAASKRLDVAKKKITDLAGDQSCKGSGITASYFYRKGNVDYKAVPELKGVDLEAYRKEPSCQFRITVEK